MTASAESNTKRVVISKWNKKRGGKAMEQVVYHTNVGSKKNPKITSRTVHEPVKKG